MNGTDLTTFTHVDGTSEKYYSGNDNRFLNKALELLTTYGNWAAANGNLYMTRGSLDLYLPIQLRNIQHSAADAMETRLGDYVWSQRSPLGLVPTSFNYLDTANNIPTANKQHVSFPLHASELLSWFEKDRTYGQNAAGVCAATKTYHDFAGGGVYPWADVTTGASSGTLNQTKSYGALALGMAIVTNVTRDIGFLQWVDQKIDFVWAQRPSRLPILADLFTPQAYVVNEPSDTDTLYYVRYLFEMWELFAGKPAYQKYADKYLAQALAVVNQWDKTGWMQQFGHFTRKLNFTDGSPADTRIYGDGKWNTLFVLVWAYRATRDRKYLERLMVAWENLLTMSTNTQPGLVDERFDSGVGNGVLEAGHQTQFLNVLLDAYEASNNLYFLAHAVALADGMLVKGDVVFPTSNGEAGASFLRLSLKHEKIRRLRVIMGGKDLAIKIKSEQGEPKLFTRVPADIAMVYLPQGSYVVNVESYTKTVSLDSDLAISFP